MQPHAFPIDLFFPAAQYLPVCNANKAFVPLFLIARNQSFDSIQKAIKANEDAGRTWDCSYPIWDVTPLHVAVWRQNFAVLKFLLEDKKCDPTKGDAIGFLPVHWAEAIGNEEITGLIRSATKTDYVSHCAVWDRYLAQATYDAGEPLFSYINEKEEVVEGTAFQFTELTRGAVFASTIFFRNRQAMVERFAKTLCDTGNSLLPQMHFEPEWVRRLESEPPPLCLSRQSEAGWGVKAMRKLQSFVPIAIYAGEGVSKDDREMSGAGGDYFLNGIEAHRFRNLAGMINEGFPNCYFDSVHTSWGCVVPVVVPFRDIAEGEQLLIDYLEEHSIKKMKRIELNLNEARSFLQEGGFLPICEKLLSLVALVKQKRGHAEKEEIQQMSVLASKVHYLLYTHSVLLHLVLERTIQTSELQAIAADERFVPIFGNSAQKHYEFRQFMEIFQTIEQFDRITDWDVFKEMHEILLKLSDNYHAETMTAAFNFLASTVQQQLVNLPKVPKEAFKLMFRTFETAIPAFEMTRSCIHERRDVSDVELEELKKLRKGHPGVESLYLSLYSKLDLKQSPNLRRFLEESDRLSRQASGPEANISRLTGMFRALMPSGAPPEVVGMLDQFEANPQMQAALVELLKGKFNQSSE